MKRYFVFCLALLLLLSGCAANVENPTTEATTEAITDKELSVAMEDGVLVSGLNDWHNFYFLHTYGETAEISINSTYDGVTYRSTLSYDGERYTLSEEDSTRSYKHLIYSSQNLPAQSNYDFAEYYLLSDDPEMTAERYFNYMVSSTFQPGFSATTIVLSDYMTFPRAETFGNVPARFASKKNINLLRYASFGKDGFCYSQLLSRFPDIPSASVEDVRKCYTYNFEVLPNNSLPEAKWDCKGYYDGKPISYDDKLFAPKSSDRLPDIAEENAFRKLYNVGVFDYETGYILVRAQYFGWWKHNSPVRSYLPSYQELIVTAYDEDGTPLWQTTSDIFIG